MTADPFLELRIRDDAVEPDAEFRRSLRARLEGSSDDALFREHGRVHRS